jgi:hypothetical protein
LIKQNDGISDVLLTIEMKSKNTNHRIHILKVFYFCYSHSPKM